MLIACSYVNRAVNKHSLKSCKNAITAERCGGEFKSDSGLRRHSCQAAFELHIIFVHTTEQKCEKNKFVRMMWRGIAARVPGCKIMYSN